MIRRARHASLLVLLSSAALVACSSDASSTGPGNTLTVRGSADAAPAAMHIAAAYDGIAGSVTYSGDPSSMTVGVYALYISANADCSSPVQVEDNGSVLQNKDFVNNPVLFTGNPAAGAYKCVMIKMSDVLNFTSASTFGGCAAGHAYSGDIYRADNSDGDTWLDKDLNPIAAHGTDDAPVDDKVTIFITRDTAAVAARGVSRHQTIALASDLVVPGQTTFYWNAHGSVQTDGVACGLQPGRPEFR